jgi:hypothetical protein
VDVTYGIVHPGSMFDSGHVAHCRSIFVSVKGFYHICGNLKVLSQCKSAHDFIHGSYQFWPLTAQSVT